MIHLDLFSGIGGFALAVDEVWPGAEHIFCEVDPYCQALLKKRFEGSVVYGDIRELKGDDICQRLKQRRTPDGKKNGEQETQKRSGNIGENTHTAIETSLEVKTELPQKNDGKRIEKQLSMPMGGDVCVAESLQNNSSHSTTKTMTGISSESSLGKRGHIDEQLKKDFQTPISCFATTAISQGQFTENAHTEVQIDILTAGVPCQPASQAGKRRGTKDDRWLWGEAFRIIRETQPRFVILENVRGILTLEQGVVFKSLITEMESCGYETRAYIIPAVAKNAPHRRDRVWFVACNANIVGRTSEEEINTAKVREQALNNASGRYSNAPDTENNGLKHSGIQEDSQCSGTERRDTSTSGNYTWNQNWLEVATELCGVDDGLPAELDGLKLSKSKHRVERLKALGNAIVSQVAVEIMQGIRSTKG